MEVFMSKKKKPLNNDQDNFEEDLETEVEDEKINDELDIDSDREPLFPFDKMTYQEKGEIEPGENLHDYEMGSDQKLNLGESASRQKKRTLRDERGAGHEP